MVSEDDCKIKDRILKSGFLYLKETTIQVNYCKELIIEKLTIIEENITLFLGVGGDPKFDPIALAEAKSIYFDSNLLILQAMFYVKLIIFYIIFYIRNQMVNQKYQNYVRSVQ